MLITLKKQRRIQQIWMANRWIIATFEVIHVTSKQISKYTHDDLGKIVGLP